MKEGADILNTLAKRSPELDAGLDVWGAVSFEYESTDKADAK